MVGARQGVYNTLANSRLKSSSLSHAGLAHERIGMYEASMFGLQSVHSLPSLIQHPKWPKVVTRWLLTTPTFEL